MSMTQDVHGRLKDQILEVERSPGTLLLEAQLAEEFGVSKTPVREALRLLAQSGWIVVLPRKGYMIRPVELGDVRDVFKIRKLVEPPLAAEAARRATSADIERLRSLLDQQHLAKDDFRAALLAAREFHLGFADIAGSARSRMILEDLLDEVRRLYHLLPVRPRITSDDEIRAHAKILEAVEAGDATAASKFAARHLNHAVTTLVKGFAGV
jgi:DNA-binding GntR family transcriptional regulator